MLNSIRLSELCDEVVVVPPPAAGLAFVTDSKGLWWHDASNWEYAPAGGWLIRNAAVDRNNAIGPWSPAVLMTMPLGWKIFGSTSNMPKVEVDPQGMPGVFLQHPDMAAVVWKAERVSDGYTFWLVQGQRSGYGAYEYEKDPEITQAPYPWSTTSEEPYGLVPFDRGNANKPIATSTLLTFTPGVPQVWLCEHNLAATEVAMAWVTHSGETALSPSLLLSSPHPAGVKGFRRMIFANPEEVPSGVLGYYLYEKINGQWRRQLSKPWYAGTSGNDKYFYDPSDMQPILWTSLDDSPVHAGPAPGTQAWSINSPMYRALRSDANAIIVDAPAYTYAPLVDPCKPPPVVNGVPDPAWFNRSVQAPGQGAVVIEQRSTVPPLGDNTAPNNHPTYWPLLIESCDGMQATCWHNLSFLPDASRGPGASLCVTARDFSGGQGFEASFIDPVLSPLGKGSIPFVKKGLYIGWENAHHPGSHNASEWVIRRAKVYGDTAIEINGTQAVNFVIDGLSILGMPAAKMAFDGSEVYLRFVKLSAYDSFLRLGWVSSVHIDRLFVDRHGHTLVHFASHEVKGVRIDGAYLKSVDFLARSPVGVGTHTLTMRDRTTYEPGSGKAVLYAVLPDKLLTDFAGSEDIEASLSLAVPARLDSQARYLDGVVP